MSDFMKQLPSILKGNGGSNKYSSKRVVTFLLTITLVSVTVANTFFGFEIEEHIYDGLVNVLIWSLGFVGSEQFAGAITNGYQKRSAPRLPDNHPDAEGS